MREIKYIVFHCTATSQNTKVESIVKYWKEKLGWKNPGYHHIVKPDGMIVDLQPIEQPSNGVAGYNKNAIHISYIGGKDFDNRTEKQKITLRRLARHYKRLFPNAEMLGHRDFPKVTKSCPRFDVKNWLKEEGI